MSSPAVSSSMLAPSGSMNDVSALGDHPTTDGVMAYAEDPKDKEEEDEPQAMQGPEVLQVYPKKFEISLRLNMSYHLELKLKNISQSVVAFKVKTTAPKRYMVRPTQDCIAPGETKQVQIIFAKLKEYPDVTKPRQLRDKFLVQSLSLPSAITTEALQTLWKEKEAQHDPKSGRLQYYEHKIKCKLLVPVQERAAMASRLGGAQAAELDQQAAVLLPASSGSVQPEPSAPPTTAAPVEAPVTVASAPEPTPSVRLAADPAAAASSDAQSTQPIPSAASAAQLSVQEAYKKAKQYDELLDFTVRLTEESERMKEERKTLVDRFREGADEVKRLRSEVDSLSAKLREAESRAAAAQQTAGAVSEVEVIAGTGLRQRRTGNSVTVLENHANDSSSTQPQDDKSAKGLHLELWQLIFLLIVVFFVGFFLS